MIPEGIVDSEWPRIERRIVDMAVVFDTWQTNLGELVLGLTADGLYAATVGGVTLSIPRQVGKTFTVGVLIIALCIEFPGLVVLWTAHHGRTTTKTFRSIQAIVKRKRIAPHLAAGGGIRTANGEQEIAFANTSIIMFGAREHGFGRGVDGVDIIVFDEAQILGEKALEDMVATTNQARHIHGALLFYMGTPPRPDDNGEAFTAKRTKALDGRMKNGVYVECSADKGADPDDRKQWAIANPSFPHHTPVEAMERMRENLPSDDSWRLEAYGIWPEVGGTPGVYPYPEWVECKDELSAVGPAGFLVFGLDVSWKRDMAYVAVAGEREDGLTHAQLIHTCDPSDVVAYIVSRAKLFNPAGIAVQGAGSPAASLIEDLKSAIEDEGLALEVTEFGGSEMARACGFTFDAIKSGALRHTGQENVDAAVKVAVGRNIGDGVALDRKKSPADIAGVVAITNAVYLLSISEHGGDPGVWFV